MAVGAKRDNGAWELRRNEIVDEAARLFAARGYHATGVAELGDAVGLGRGALDDYIELKENLLGSSTIVSSPTSSRLVKPPWRARERRRSGCGSSGAS